MKYPVAGHKGSDFENVHVYQLQVGDVTTGGATILSKPTAGLRTPKGKMEVFVQYPNGVKKVQLWGKHTVIGIKKKDMPSQTQQPDQAPLKEQVKKYLVKNIKKAIKENCVTGGGSPAVSTPVTGGGVGEAHQGSKKIKVKKNFKENFTKVITSNPKFAKNLKKIKEASFKIPVEKLVDWASKNVLYSTSSPYAAIQQYAEQNNTTVENIRQMAKFYVSNSEMFGNKKNDYVDVLKDLIANIDEISTESSNPYHNKTALKPSENDPYKENLNEMRYSQFAKQAVTRNPSEALHQSIKEINKRIKEVRKIMEFASRMKTEFKSKYSAQYMERTNKMLNNLQTQLVELYKHFKQIK